MGFNEDKLDEEAKTIDIDYSDLFKMGNEKHRIYEESEDTSPSNF